MKHEAMKRAISQRRGKGLDIKILLGHSGPNLDHGGDGGSVEPRDKNSDLAPPGDHSDESQDRALIQDELGKHDAMDEAKDKEMIRAELMRREAKEGSDESMLDGSSDYEKQDMMSRERPRSLGERARMAAMHRIHKK